MTDTVERAEATPPTDDTVAAPTSVPRIARVLGNIGRGLILAGIVVLLFVAFQLFGTNIQEARAQSGLRTEFDEKFTPAQTSLDLLTPPTVPDLEIVETDNTEPDLASPSTTSTLTAGLDPEVLAFFFPEDGDAVARLEIPAIGIDKIVVNGVQVADLRKGPGRYPDTALFGNLGNAAIAGHRTTYGAPFNRIDELQPGDEIRTTGVLGTFTYRVLAPDVAYAEQYAEVEGSDAGHIIVRPSDTWVLGDFGDNRITLTACHPKLSSRQRIIVAAELVGQPVEIPDLVDAVIALPAEDDAPPLELGADDVATDDTVEDEPQASDPTTPAFSTAQPTPITESGSSLDEGLDGERGAIPGAVGWMLGAIAFWVLGGIGGRRLYDGRWPRVGARLAGLLPAAICLWFSFEMIDRALPAG